MKSSQSSAAAMREPHCRSMFPRIGLSLGATFLFVTAFAPASFAGGGRVLPNGDVEFYVNFRG